MAKIKLKVVDQISRKKVSDAFDSFMRHCKLKNLAPYSILYYESNVGFFLNSLPKIKYVDEINQECVNDFISMLMDRGNRVTAINARLRAAHVFLRYCFEQEYMHAHIHAYYGHLSKVRTPRDAPQLSRTIRLLSKD